MHKRKKTDAETECSKAQKKYDDAIYKNGELTQADVDQAQNAEKEAENAVKEQKRQVESKQTAADAAKQALETAKQEFDNLGGAHRHCRMQKAKKRLLRQKSIRLR